MTEAIELIHDLSHELGVALEFSFTPTEIKHLWLDAITSLERAKNYLEVNHNEVPPVIINVLGAVKRVE
jgi:hypothetical protein